MYTQVHRPRHLAPAALDGLLARGWYRMGTALFTCRFVTLEDGVLRSAIWTRQELADFEFRSSHRKLLAKARKRFRVTVGPAVLDEAREVLYQRYLTTARGDRSEDLYSFLGDEDHDGPFDTREVALYDEHGLAAFSWFDLGERAAMSLIGVYEPEHARHSLGFTTMLLEIEEALGRGLQFHYSGYVLPGHPAMDYKLRAASQFFEAETGRWRPLADLDGYTLPVDRLRRRLDVAQRALADLGVGAVRVRYPHADLAAWNAHLSASLRHPLVLICGRGPSGVVLVVYDLDTGHYLALRCALATLKGASDDSPMLLMVDEELAASEQVDEVVDAVASLRAVGRTD